jgi:signal transduction histidine kinase
MLLVPPMSSPTAVNDYAAVLSQRVAAERLTLAAEWLQQLRQVIAVPADNVFPSAQLLDHIPALVEEIAFSLIGPGDREIAANTAVIAKARELGQLRHAQRASVHQLLHEYEILGDLLETFLVEETERLSLRPSPAECFMVQRRLTHAVRVLMRTTVDTFISEYTTTIQDQSERILAFNRAASHELRSPIGTLMFAGALLDKDVVRQDSQRLAKVAATVRASAERLAWLVENLQRLARVGGDALDVPSRQRVEIGALAADVAHQLDEMAQTRKVTVRVEPNLPAIVADAARLELVLLNLVSNAIKYSDASKPECVVEIGPAADPPGADAICAFRVSDNGIGIPASDQPAIFDRFFRAHAHRDTELGVTGTGLGLAIVGDCVQALGGSIRCESTPGRGTNFIITLPCEPPPPDTV